MESVTHYKCDFLVEKQIIQRKLWFLSAGQLSFMEQHPATPITSFTLSYRINKSNLSSVWMLQVLNATQTPDFEANLFNVTTQTVEPIYSQIMILNLSWWVEF